MTIGVRSEVNVKKWGWWSCFCCLLCTCSIWAVTLTRCFYLYTVTDQDVVFLVLDLCRATASNYDISADAYRTRLERRLFLLSLDGCFGQINTIYKQEINLHSLLTKGSLFYLFLKLVQLDFLFSDDVRILSIYLKMFKVYYWNAVSNIFIII